MGFMILGVFLLGLGFGYLFFSNKKEKGLENVNYQEILKKMDKIKDYKLNLEGIFEGKTISVSGEAVISSNKNLFKADILKSDLEALVSMKYEFLYDENEIWISSYAGSTLLEQNQLGTKEEIPDVLLFDSTRILAFVSEMLVDNASQCVDNICSRNFKDEEKNAFLSLINLITLNAYEVLNSDVTPKLMAVFNKSDNSLEKVEIEINDHNKMTMVFIF